MSLKYLDGLESVVAKVKEGIHIKAIDEDRELIVNQVIGYHPSVGFNFSGRYTTPVGTDASTGEQVCGGRGFKFADYNRKWVFAEEVKPVLKKFRVYGSYWARDGLCCQDLIVMAIDEKDAENKYYNQFYNKPYTITRVEEVNE